MSRVDVNKGNPRYRGEGYRYVRSRWTRAGAMVTDMFEGRGGRVVRTRTVKGTRDQQQAAVDGWLRKANPRVDVNKGRTVAKKKAATKRKTMKRAAKPTPRKLIKKAAKKTAKRNSSAGELAERAVRRATKAYLKSGRTAKKVSVKVNPRIAPKMLQAYGQAFQRMLRAPYNQDTPKSVLMESFLAQHKIPVTEQARVKIYLGKVAKKNPRRKGSASLTRAKKAFKLFHGRKPTKVSARRVSKARRLPGNDFVKLGDLNYLKVKNPALAGGMIDFGLKERPVLATDPKRKRLFIIGGNQKLDGIPSVAGSKRNPGGLADLGELEQLEYFTRKQFDNYVPANYYHDLGEENGKRPRLMYDRKNQQLHVVGGDYKIQAAGIRN